jgi:hypothetical protein
MFTRPNTRKPDEPQTRIRPKQRLEGKANQQEKEVTENISIVRTIPNYSRKEEDLCTSL